MPKIHNGFIVSLRLACTYTIPTRTKFYKFPLKSPMSAQRFYKPDVWVRSLTKVLAKNVLTSCDILP